MNAVREQKYPEGVSFLLSTVIRFHDSNQEHLVSY